MKIRSNIRAGRGGRCAGGSTGGGGGGGGGGNGGGGASGVGKNSPPGTDDSI